MFEKYKNQNLKLRRCDFVPPENDGGQFSKKDEVKNKSLL